MRANRNLREALLSKLGVTRQRLSQRVQETKKRHGPMTTAEATYVIAHQEGLDLTKYVDGDTVNHVRGLIPKAGQDTSKGRPNKKSARNAGSTISLPGKVPKVDIFLSTTLARDAQEMAKLYPTYYVLENSMRVVIRRVLEHAHGKGWWAECAPREVQRTVDDRKNEESKKPWHGKRNAHEIYYSDFGDLRRIIEKNWADLSRLFPSRPWITNMLDQLEHPRNVMAHHNPVSNNDRKRVELYFEDWAKLLESKKDTIP